MLGNFYQFFTKSVQLKLTYQSFNKIQLSSQTLMLLITVPLQHYSRYIDLNGITAIKILQAYTKYKIIDSPTCSCKKGEQTIDHTIYDCELVQQERKRLKAAVPRTEKWPAVLRTEKWPAVLRTEKWPAVLRTGKWSIRKDILVNKYSKNFNKFTESITFDKL